MTREEAIEILARADVARLPAAEREAVLIDWWSIDADDPRYYRLPDELKTELSMRTGPDDASKALYEPLLLMGLRPLLVGVTNAYLERRLAQMGHFIKVDGPIERLEVCPCCGYCTLPGSGEHDICRVCFWQDDGVRALDQISNANHMTLRQGQQSFASIGAVSESALPQVLTDGRERYAHAIFSQP